MRKLKLLLLFVGLFTAFNSTACDEAYITFNSETDNGDGTYTYNFDLCVEFNGLEGNPDWFSLEFSGATYTSIASYSPSVISTSSGDNYNGAITGDELRWTTPSIFTAHCCQNLCTNVTVTTNGQVESIVVTYSDEFVSYPTCQETINFPIPCDVVGVTAGTQSACDPGTNTYSQDVIVTYSSAPSTGDLDVNGQLFGITSSPQTVTLTGLVANGLGVGVTAFFTDDPFCSFTDNLLFVAPEDCTPCSISSVTAGTQTACDPGTNTYTQEITVTYNAEPGTGTLDVNGQSFTISTSPQTVTLTGLTADGNAVDVTATFSADPGCTSTLNSAFTAPASCATPCTPDNGSWD